MVRGLLRSGLAADHIHCTCGNDPTGASLAAETGIHYHRDPAHLMDRADLLVLACKPQQLQEIDGLIPPQTKGRLVLSILAGVTLATLRRSFPDARNLIRCMPNTPGQIGSGITVYTPLEPLEQADTAAVNRLLESLGTVLTLAESHMDAVTAVSGSGPAYLFEFTAALTAAAVEAGLPPEAAAGLARQTVCGAAALLAQSDESPDALRAQVTSPGGTTEAALNALEKGAFRSLVTQAVKAACKRSRELGA